MTAFLCGEEYLLCSYPRTANTWVRYMIETVFHYPTAGPGGGFYRGVLPYGNRKKLFALADREFGLPIHSKLKNREKIFLKIHDLEAIENRNKPLILILRNFKECIPSQLKHSQQEGNFLLTYLRMFQSEAYYFENIRLFDERRGAKLLIYFEDLMENPRKELERLARFVGSPTDEIEKFVDNISTHKKTLLDYYKRIGHFHPNTYGKERDYFSREWTDHEKRLCDEEVKKTYPKLWKYLRRYAQ